MKYSLFKNKYNDDLQTLECGWDEFADWAAALPAVESKHDAPLFSLCTYGDYIPDGGTLRRNAANIAEVWGIEVDYDGGSIGFDTAVLRAEQAGVEALIYTSPSHTPDEPRWRMVCPFDEALDLDAREAALERINGLFGGSIDPSSFTKSQAFFVGPVQHGEDGSDALSNYRVKRVRGASIAKLEGLQRIPKGHRTRVGGEHTMSTEADYVADVERGVNIHPALRSLSYRWKWSEEKLLNLAHRSAARTDNPKRYKRMIGGEIKELVESARERRLEQIAAEVQRVAPPPEPDAPPPRVSLFSSLRELRREFPPLVWAIKGIMEADTMGEIYGDSGAGKSFCTVDMAMCLASGTPWCGREVRQGAVLYINGEGERGIMRRAEAWLQHYRPDGNWDFPLFFSKRAIPLAAAEGKGITTLYDEVAQIHATGVKVEYVFIDTLSRMFLGIDQNAQTGMQYIAETLDKIKRDLECTVIVVHHTGKLDKSTGKGAVDLKGALDWEFGFHSLKGEVKQLVCTKMKDGKEWSPLFFELIERQIPVLENGRLLHPDMPPQYSPPMSSAVLVPYEGVVPAAEGAKGGKKEKKESKAGKLDRQCVIDIMKQENGLMPKDKIKEEFMRLRPGGGTDSAKTSAFYRVWKNLEAGGIVVEDKGDFMLGV